MPRLGVQPARRAGRGDRALQLGLVDLGPGIADLLIPIAIAALIVPTTMLGAVYERFNEIGIFSSIGPAPVPVAILFLAEALVYPIIGAILGYLAVRSWRSCWRRPTC
ncbi:MAG: ABC transporter permease [Gammaproteobacteria bacterium]|nr:ABC transporter permease [Gammaproteobacteria bacterium]